MVNKRKESGSKSAAKSTNKKPKKEQVDISSSSTSSSSKKRLVKNVAAKEESDFVEEPVFLEEEDSGAEIVEDEVEADELLQLPAERKIKRRVADDDNTVSNFVGEPVPHDVAVRRWPNRYQKMEKKNLNKTIGAKGSNGEDDAEEPIYAIRHYLRGEVDGQIYCLDDDAYVQGEDDNQHYICKIREFFQGEDKLDYFTAQWFYRAEDTVIKNCGHLIEGNRVFFSEIRNDNPLDCLVKKLKINRLPQNMNPERKAKKKLDCDYYYDMMYILPYCTFQGLPNVKTEIGTESDSTVSSDSEVAEVFDDVKPSVSLLNTSSEKMLLDLYSGCGGMSTGLCLGANSSGLKLTTKWAVDINPYACESLRWNHPETQVRNEPAENFLSLLKEWESLCVACSLYKSSAPPHPFFSNIIEEEEEIVEEEEGDVEVDNEEIFEVDEILNIMYGDPKENKKTGLYFKIRWKGYGVDEDTWEPIDGLSDCPKKLKDFVSTGFKNMILPLPGHVDVICGGPPCQGISGYNRFRNKEDPLKDEKNKQLIVYMDIVGHLKPRYVLMENVVDILKFAGGFLGRYAFGKLVGMDYQARLGMMAAGAYGLPQFRMRIFLWGALAGEKLPGYPLPTHHVVNRGVVPKEFEANLVAYEEVLKPILKKELFLGDAISDLPPVQNDEGRDEMPYGDEPKTELQRFIRLRRDEMPGSLTSVKSEPHLLYDHRPLNLNNDDYQRVCRIPKKKGANFRDLPGVRVRPDNVVEWDPAIPRVYLDSKKPLVPDYAMSFVRGTSSKPFGRLWYDETVPTVMTRAEPHNHALLHPFQDRVLTVRENARLQGFPDYYKLFGPIKERYIQVGNAVAVPVARALGYSLARTCLGLSPNDVQFFSLPQDFPFTVQVPIQSPSPDVVV